MIHNLSGEAVATAMAEDLIVRTTALRKASIIPHLWVVKTHGDVPLDSYREREIDVYRRQKQELGERVGVKITPLFVHVEELDDVIQDVNRNESVHGVIFKTPIPGFEKKDYPRQFIDLDGPKSVDHQAFRSPWAMGATSEAGIVLLDSHGVTTPDMNFLVIGAGDTGGPIADELQLRLDRKEIGGLEVIASRVAPEEQRRLARKAGAIVVATGKPGTLPAEDVEEGHIITSIGADDVAPEVRNIEDRDFTLTPRVGGIGRITVPTLLRRVVTLAEGGAAKPPTFNRYRAVAA